MFYAPLIELDAVRKTPDLPNQLDPVFWRVVSIQEGIALYFSILNPETGPLGRIISAITGSGVYHTEVWLDDKTSELASTLINEAEDKLGLPYDIVGALRAWDNSGYHTPGREFCSGLAYELLKPILPHLVPYANPGKLMADVSAMCGIRMAELPPVAVIGDAEIDYLNDLHDTGKIACGVLQETLRVMGV